MHLLHECAYPVGLFTKLNAHRAGRRANSSIVAPIADMTVSRPARIKTNDKPMASVVAERFLAHVSTCDKMPSPGFCRCVSTASVR